jgi:maltooligosyltrehalose trehalohydrolase
LQLPCLGAECVNRRAAIACEQSSHSSLYTFVLNNELERADPASRFQPLGVAGPSAVVSRAFEWADDNWRGLSLNDYIIYELHVGTFTRPGTFEAVIPKLPDLRELGVTAIELMPLAQFPGARNWGYDGVYLFAVQNTYGGPEGLKRLINAAHAHGIAVIVDIVYNHFGPEGNYLRDFGPYFTSRYKTPWGDAINFDGEYSDDVRRFFIENALYWQAEFHVDALRLDAVHAIHDESATPFLTELARATRARAEILNRPFHLMAESDLNDARLVSPEAIGGQGIDSQWSDDFHHCLHVMLTGEQNGYYTDFTGDVRQFAKVLTTGFAYTGEYSPARKRRHGNRPKFVRPQQFIVCAQNHDQVGNRLLGDRLARLTSFEGLKLAAATVLLSPYTPLLFMGEEWGEQRPFAYFVDHSDPALVEAVRKGRAKEFALFGWQRDAPDPQCPTTFEQCVIDPAECSEQQLVLRKFYRALLALRKQTLSAEEMRASRRVLCDASSGAMLLTYAREHPNLVIAFNFSPEPMTTSWPVCRQAMKCAINSAQEQWLGPGGDIPAVIPAMVETSLTLPPRAVVAFADGASDSLQAGEDHAERDRPSNVL